MLIAGVELLAFTVQKEVGLRIAGQPGTEDYGPLTVMAQMLSRAEILRTLPPQAFWPPPKIDSALVRLTRDDRLGDKAGPFGKFVHTLFSFRRKTLRRGLLQAGFDADAILKSCDIDGQNRAEQFSPEVFLEMFDAIEGDRRIQHGGAENTEEIAE
jgi:16S rRNA (adenine1518-N6/adenine1519-N6)-dimethyltransferase